MSQQGLARHMIKEHGRPDAGGWKEWANTGKGVVRSSYVGWMEIHSDHHNNGEYVDFKDETTHPITHTHGVDQS